MSAKVLTSTLTMYSTELHSSKRFLVALSFPGEHRNFVRQIAEKLAASFGAHRVLYDAFYEAEFARPDLDVYLQGLYHDESELIVVFVCEAFELKEWCGVEWRAIRDLMKKRSGSSIMFVRMDDADVRGVFSIDGYVSVHGRPPDDIAELIQERLLALSSNRVSTAEERSSVIAPDLFADSQLDELLNYEQQGRYDVAIKYLIDNWNTIKSWESLVNYFRLLEITGGDHAGLERAAAMEEALFGKCPEHLRIQRLYFLGRLRGQLGFKMDALNSHDKNAQHSGSGNLYALKSQFEVGQILFRIEDFVGSQATLKALGDQLDPNNVTHSSLRVDVLKFLATFEMTHVIFDVLEHETCLQGWTAGNYRRCLDLAKQTISLADQNNYIDGSGWGHVVYAFAEEGQRHSEGASAAYDRAEEIIRMPGAKRSSLVYALLYRAGFERRRNNLAEAAVQLEKAEAEFPQMNRRPYEAALHEQQALIAHDQNKQEEVAQHLKEALLRYAADSGIRYRTEWPFVKRLRSICKVYGWNLSHFFEGKYTTEH